MIEKAARAAYEIGRTSSWQAEEFGNKVYWYELARAVLDAITEPSEEMIEAGLAARNFSVNDVYQAMINKAKESK